MPDDELFNACWSNDMSLVEPLLNSGAEYVNDFETLPACI